MSSSIDQSTSMVSCCIEKTRHIYCCCRYCSSFEIHGDFFLGLIDEQRNVLSVEFESAEKYTGLLQNTYSFQMDNSTRQMLVNFGYISCVVNLQSIQKILPSFTLKLNYKHWLYKLFCSSRNESKKPNRKPFYERLRLS